MTAEPLAQGHTPPARAAFVGVAQAGACDGHARSLERREAASCVQRRNPEKAD